MNAHRIEVIIPESGTLILHDLPFKPGTSLEIIVLERSASDQVEAVDDEHPADWLQASKRALWEVWNNDEDAVYDAL